MKKIVKDKLDNFLKKIKDKKTQKKIVDNSIKGLVFAYMAVLIVPVGIYTICEMAVKGLIDKVGELKYLIPEKKAKVFDKTIADKKDFIISNKGKAPLLVEAEKTVYPKTKLDRNAVIGLHDKVKIKE